MRMKMGHEGDAQGRPMELQNAALRVVLEGVLGEKEGEGKMNIY